MKESELNSDCDKFLSKVRENIDTELRKFGLYLMNINISDIRDAANYIVNLGNITVFDGGNGATGNFLNQLVKTVAPSLGVLDKLPIGETVKNIIKPEEKGKDEKTAGK